MNIKTWSVQFKPASGRGPWFCLTIEAVTREMAIDNGWRIMAIEGGAWKLAKVYEVTDATEEAA